MVRCFPQFFVCCSLLITIACLHGSKQAFAEPPRVVKATPENGDLDVDPATREIRVTFDQPMNPDGMSVVGGGESFPEPEGKPRWRDGGKTFAFPVKLQPEHEYQLSINNPRFTNFKNRAGESAVPYPIRFRTAAATADANPATADSSNQRAIEVAREAIDSSYSYRDRLNLDWDKVFTTAEKSLLRSRDPEEFAKKLGMLLAKAEDKHIWLTVGDKTVPSFVRPAIPNANFKLLPQIVPAWRMYGRRAATGKWDDGVGYLAIGSWTRADIEKPALAALKSLAGVSKLVIDVRGNGGGDERLAQQVAGCFTDKPLLYGKHVYRSAADPSGFGAVNERRLEPNSAWPRIEARVVVLTGPVVMSSCESFLLMMRAAGATLVGDRSQGSSGNPKPHDLGNGVTLFLPSWKDLTVDGQELEGVGVAPDIIVKAAPRDFEKGDPVLEAGLKALRDQ